MTNKIRENDNEKRLPYERVIEDFILEYDYENTVRILGIFDKDEIENAIKENITMSSQNDTYIPQISDRVVMKEGCKRNFYHHILGSRTKLIGTIKHIKEHLYNGDLQYLCAVIWDGYKVLMEHRNDELMLYNSDDIKNKQIQEKEDKIEGLFNI